MSTVLPAVQAANHGRSDVAGTRNNEGVGGAVADRVPNVGGGSASNASSHFRPGQDERVEVEANAANVAGGATNRVHARVDVRRRDRRLLQVGAVLGRSRAAVETEDATDAEALSALTAGSSS